MLSLYTFIKTLHTLSIICKHLMSFYQQMKAKLGILDVFEANFAAIICWVILQITVI